jgi:hypothetical protein
LKLTLHGAGFEKNGTTGRREKMAAIKILGVCFTYTPEARHPQIPSIKDVLYVLQIVKEPDAYKRARDSWPVYVANVHLVVAFVAVEVLNPERDTQSREIIIARWILWFCPPEARCLRVTEFTALLKVFKGAARLPYGATDSQWAGTCDCPLCNMKSV